MLPAGWILIRQELCVVRPRTSSAQLNLPGRFPAWPGCLGTRAWSNRFIDTTVTVDNRCAPPGVLTTHKHIRRLLTWIKGNTTIVAGVTFAGAYNHDPMIR